MRKKCPNCNLVDYPNAEKCARCGRSFDPEELADVDGSLKRRATVCAFVCLAAVIGFYLSMVFSASPLTIDQKRTVLTAIDVLDAKGFTSEALLLKRVAVFRSNDNWFNASVVKERAFAATNFPFEIITVYPDFFSVPANDVDRAAILLHEARHLKGANEKDAYEFVWRNRKKLGWTSQDYSNSEVWNEVRKQTRDYASNLFVCDMNPFGDCTVD